MVLLTELTLDSFCSFVGDMMTVHAQQHYVMTAMALPLHRKVTPVTGRNHPVSEVMTCLTAGYTFVLLTMQVVVVHASLLIACLMHEAQFDGGRIIADALCQPSVLQCQSHISESQLSAVYIRCGVKCHKTRASVCYNIGNCLPNAKNTCLHFLHSTDQSINAVLT